MQSNSVDEDAIDPRGGGKSETAERNILGERSSEAELALERVSRAEQKVRRRRATLKAFSPVPILFPVL